MRRIKATVEYDGRNYCGFQIQPNGITVQEVIETALKNLTGEVIKVVCSGRTDSGVHAVGQVIHFDTDTAIPTQSIPLALTPYLPKDIALIECTDVSPLFHARYSAVNKTYIYKVCLSKINRPLMRGRYYIVKYDVDIESMLNAAKSLQGEHDFAGFMSSGSSVENTVRNLYRLNLDIANDIITFELTANGFLYNMVRIIVGTLIDVGRGRISVEDVIEARDKADRAYSGHTAPPDGLYLMSVNYPEQLLNPEYRGKSKNE